MNTNVPEPWWEQSMRDLVAIGERGNLYPFVVGMIASIVANDHVSDAEKVVRIREVLAARKQVDAEPTAGEPEAGQ